MIQPQRSCSIASATFHWLPVSHQPTQIQEKGNQTPCRDGEQQKRVCNSMWDWRYHRSHLWKIQSATSQKGKGILENQKCHLQCLKYTKILHLMQRTIYNIIAASRRLGSIAAYSSSERSVLCSHKMTQIFVPVYCESENRCPHMSLHACPLSVQLWVQMITQKYAKCDSQVRPLWAQIQREMHFYNLVVNPQKQRFITEALTQLYLWRQARCCGNRPAPLWLMPAGGIFKSQPSFQQVLH